ncbi:MAG: helix-turn-helix transcriptional regulator [Lachnospiraceae bacterium]|nr:helix-turn-helix transcriptional regulator [Lachnospiraceae bacterium]
MKNNIVYYRKSNDIKHIYYHNSVQCYPEHTHVDHAILGYILNGKIRITCDKEEHIYNAGEYYYIPPDTIHTIDPVDDISYSMISVCISVDKMPYESGDDVICFKQLNQLKQLILDAPENVFFIKDMAHKIGISPYHMIRQFKAACGLTPHQFQIQCRVRKAQKLLEEGKSVTEAAYATGFCDQSHFDRCFNKIVRLTPSEYKQSLKWIG